MFRMTDFNLPKELLSATCLAYRPGKRGLPAKSLLRYTAVRSSPTTVQLEAPA